MSDIVDDKRANRIWIDDKVEYTSSMQWCVERSRYGGNIDATLCIRDCADSTDFDFGFGDYHNRTKTESLAKLDRIIGELKAFRAAIADSRDPDA